MEHVQFSRFRASIHEYDSVELCTDFEEQDGSLWNQRSKIDNLGEQHIADTWMIQPR